MSWWKLAAIKLIEILIRIITATASKLNSPFKAFSAGTKWWKDEEEWRSDKPMTRRGRWRRRRRRLEHQQKVGLNLNYDSIRGWVSWPCRLRIYYLRNNVPNLRNQWLLAVIGCHFWFSSSATFLLLGARATSTSSNNNNTTSTTTTSGNKRWRAFTVLALCTFNWLRASPSSLLLLMLLRFQLFPNNNISTLFYYFCHHPLLLHTI